MNKEDVHEIDKILDITNHIVEAIHPLKIILFGSFARGEDTNRSDYDLYIIAEDKDGDDFMKQYVKARRSFRLFVERDVDILFSTAKKFEFNKQCRACVSYYVARDGVVLYEA